MALFYYTKEKRKIFHQTDRQKGKKMKSQSTQK